VVSFRGKLRRSFFRIEREGEEMKQRKTDWLRFRATPEQAQKLAEIADRAGVSTADILRRIVDGVQDVQSGGWSIVLADKQREAVQR
jgi:hypothetical protein